MSDVDEEQQASESRSGRRGRGGGCSSCVSPCWRDPSQPKQDGQVRVRGERMQVGVGWGVSARMQSREREEKAAGLGSLVFASRFVCFCARSVIATQVRATLQRTSTCSRSRYLTPSADATREHSTPLFTAAPQSTRKRFTPSTSTRDSQLRAPLALLEATHTAAAAMKCPNCGSSDIDTGQKTARE